MKKIYIGFNEIYLAGKKDTQNIIDQYKQQNKSLSVIDFKDKHQLVNDVEKIEVSREVKSYLFRNEAGDELEKRFFKLYRMLKAAGGVIRNPNDEILMVFRRGKWDLPKGKVDKGETGKEAAVREVMEETGIHRPKILKPIRFFSGAQECTYHTYFLKGKRVIKATYWFHMFSDDDEPLIPQAEEGITEAGWYSAKGLAKNLRNTYPLVHWILDEVREPA